MKYAGLFNRNLKFGWLSNNSYCNDSQLTVKRVLVLNKRTRYELEKALNPGITDGQLEELIRKRGSDFDRIYKHHIQHKQFLKRIVDCFSKYGLDVETVNRTCYGEKEVSWADLIVTGGGDGTFLLGANQILDKKKPIVGFNTDPERSEGYLCLPKKYSYDMNSAVLKILKNDFQWLLRNRIEIEIEGSNVNDEVLVIDPTKKSFTPECEQSTIDCNEPSISKRVLPSLALNEVFMGERISSQTSSLFIHPEGHTNTIVKCSGLCISTGTGSTSWHMSINRLTEDKIKKVMELCGQSVNNADDVVQLTNEYNSSLRFLPDDKRLYWSLREPIYSSVFPEPPGFPTGGFSNSLLVGSRCLSGCLVIDGTHCYPFHDGTKARIYSTPDKCLRTIHLK